MNLETEMTDSNICDCGNIDIDEAIKIAEKFIKQARVDENQGWRDKAYRAGKNFDGYCEGDFDERIEELNK